MNNKEAINILKRGYPDINRYAASESEVYEYDVETYNEAVEYAISHLEADRWIPVSERLPEDFCVVLVYCPQFDNIYRVFREGGAWHQFSPSDVLMQAVTHWRPLPKSPESETKNE